MIISSLAKVKMSSFKPPLEHSCKSLLYGRRLAKEKVLLQSKKGREELALVKV